MTDWSLQLLAQTCNGKIEKSSDQAITGFSTDSRTIQPGNVYFALSGENFNGHRFVEAALQNRASGAVVSEDFAGQIPEDCFIIRVNDCLQALQACAAYYRRQHPGFFIAVTGSNGKTTTRSMLAHLLNEDYVCASTSGNLNNHIGLPLTILSVPPQAEYVVLEMGMNHAGEIRDLCRIAAPEAALISNIGPAHIGILGSLENIARAKAEIFEEMPADSIKVAPADTEFSNLFREIAGDNLSFFGCDETADLQVIKIEPGIDSVSFSLIFNHDEFCCRLRMPGRHNAMNAAAALAVYQRLGLPLEKGIKRLESFAAVSARMELVVKDEINILLDCYNANPGSMREALHYLNVCPTPRIAVLGDMRELGDLSQKMHEEIGKLAAELAIERLITVGEDARFIAQAAVAQGLAQDQVNSLNSHDEAAELLNKQLKAGATVLFKASRGMHFEKIIRKIWPELAEDLH
jgi:UDP-N-acetylmuramoyl-tripeptide--D-alanyl-D-alanine ligase